MRAPAPSRVARAIAEAAAATGVSPKEIRNIGMRASPKVSRARWIAWKTVVDAGFPVAAVARAWPCDHTSILYGLRRLAEEAA